MEISQEKLDKFWHLVDEINWSDNCKNRGYEKIKLHMMKNLEHEWVKEASFIRCALYNEISECINRWEDDYGQIEVSDDGLSDLINHIIGLGKKEFDRCMKNPALAKRRADRCDFVESFSYCFPHDNEYEKFQVDHYQEYAKNYSSEFEELLNKPAFHLIKDKIQYIIDTLTLISEGRLKEALKREYETDITQVAIRKYCDQNHISYGFHYGIENLFHDMKLFEPWKPPSNTVSDKEKTSDDELNKLWNKICEYRRILRGDILGPSEMTNQDILGIMAYNLRVLAIKLDDIRQGEPSLVLFSEEMEGD